MRILLLGFGISNKAVYKYFNKQNEITIDIIDDNDKKRIKDRYVSKPIYDYCFRSPGIGFDNPLYLISKNCSKYITNEIDYSLSLLKDKKIIGVTGSDGKTSLVSLINHVLSKNHSTFLGGNIGITLLDKISEIKNKEYIILELSSFQLEDINNRIDLGIIKNMHPNHLDTYKNKELYYSYKTRIRLLANNLIIGKNINLESNNILTYNIYKKGHFIFEDKDIIFDLANINHKDESFIENIIITLKLLKYYKLKYIHIEDDFKDFKGVKYRNEYLGEYKNTTFINDGKSSTSASSMYAYKNYNGHKILILGGIHKSASFNFKVNKNDEVYIYGRDAKLIKKQLKCGTIFDRLSDILNIIKFDKKQTIIFSPGCSSFDQYQNYIKRSEEFEKWVYKWIK